MGCEDSSSRKTEQDLPHLLWRGDEIRGWSLQQSVLPCNPAVTGDAGSMLAPACSRGGITQPSQSTNQGCVCSHGVCCCHQEGDLGAMIPEEEKCGGDPSAGARLRPQAPVSINSKAENPPKGRALQLSQHPCSERLMADGGTEPTTALPQLPPLHKGASEAMVPAPQSRQSTEQGFQANMAQPNTAQSTFH